MEMEGPDVAHFLLSHGTFLLVKAIGLVLSLFGAYLIAQYVYLLVFHPLADIPGPRLCSVSRLPYWLAVLQGRDVKWLYQLHLNYGSVVRFGPTDISYSTAEAWKDVHGYNKGSPESIKAPEFSVQPANGVYSMLNATFEDHARVRRLFSPAFADRALKKQEGLFKDYVNKLVSRLDEVASGSRRVELTQLFNFATFDIMAHLCFGQSLGLLENNKLNPWVHSVFESLKMLPFVSIITYYPLLNSIFTRYEPKWVTEQRKLHCQFSADQVNQRLQKGSEGPDIWNLIVLAQDSENALSLEEMHSNAEVFMLAGSETTATLLSGLIYCLLTNLKQYSRLNNEIRSKFRSSNELSFSSLAECKYLNACLKEALRVYPPVPIGSPLVVPAGGKLILGKWIPPDTRVSVHHYTTYHSQDNFHNADQFVPERWIAGENTEYSSDRQEAFQPFGWGHRDCLGQNMAMHEMRLVLASVVLRFDLELCDESQDWLEQKTFTLWAKRPLLCRIDVRVSE